MISPELEMARRIEHTLLKPEATPDQIDRLCDEAVQYGFGAVCVNPVNVQRAVRRLECQAGSDRAFHHPAVVSVAGFPLGASVTSTKVEEARRAIGDGATQIDMVVRLGALVAGDRSSVREDIEAVADIVRGIPHRGILKVILETAALTDQQIGLGCRCCVEGGADFVKTSTGFHPSGGARVEHVALLVEKASPLMVKASGGIRTSEVARAMLDAGAARLGTSSGVAILGGCMTESAGGVAG